MSRTYIALVNSLLSRRPVRTRLRTPPISSAIVDLAGTMATFAPVRAHSACGIIDFADVRLCRDESAANSLCANSLFQIAAIWNWDRYFDRQAEQGLHVDMQRTLG